MLPQDIKVGDNNRCFIEKIRAVMDTVELTYWCETPTSAFLLAPIMVPFTEQQNQALLNQIKEQLD
jgi:hypothetical protein